MSAHAVLFDLDGVLVDSYEVWFALLRALTVELGYPELGREAFRAGWGQGIQADVATIFTQIESSPTVPLRDVAGSIAATVPGFRLVLGRGAYGGVELARRLAELARHA